MYTCEKCVFFKDVNTFGLGKCCRFPPIPVAITEGTNMTVHTSIHTKYPEVYNTFWCGEFQPKE